MAKSNMRRILGLGVLLLVALGPAAGLNAQGEKLLTLKLGTLAPDHSSWDNILRAMGDKWGKAGVDLEIYGNGVLGDEPDIINKMRIGQIQVSVVTVVGLSKIDKAVEVLSIPMLYKDVNESDYVRSKMQPFLEKRLEEKGFKVLNWGEAGWVYFFGKTPIYTPDDLRKMKLFIWGDDPDTMDIWQSAGFSPIPLAATDILPNLQTGMINCFDTTPMLALSYQWFALAKHMTNMKWCPLVGATIITTKAWNKIPPSARPAILKAAAVAQKGFRDDIRANSDKALAVMKEKGLEVHDITPDQYAQWEKLFDSVYPQISGKIISPDIMQMAIKFRDEYRAKHKAATE